RSRSSVPACATCAIVSPVAGLVVSKRLPVEEGTNFPARERSLWRRREGAVAVVTLCGQAPEVQSSTISKFEFRNSNLFSLSFELRNSLLLIGGNAFLCVLALEEQLLKLPLDGQGRLGGQIPTRLDGALDAPDRPRGLVGRHELPRVIHDLFPPIFRGGIDDLIEQAHLVRLLEGERV